MTLSLTAPPPETRAEWAARVRSAWGGALEAVIETGRALIAAKAQLPHGEFLAMIESDLPFKRTTAHMLMRVAGSECLACMVARAERDVAGPPSDGELVQLLGAAVAIDALERGLARRLGAD